MGSMEVFMAMVDEVQAKLASYTTPKQRKQRLRELQRMRRSSDKDTVTLDLAIEYGVLLARIRSRTDVTAAQLVARIRGEAEAGKMSLVVTVDGEPLQIRQAAI